MKTSNAMARTITEIAQAAGCDLMTVGAHVTIHNRPYMRLAIEVVGDNQVSVTHYYEQNGDLVPDPDMVFFTGYGMDWMPVHIQMNTGYFQRATEIEDGQVSKINPQAQAEQADFANMWARNIRAQGFLEAARKLGSCPGEVEAA